MPGIASFHEYLASLKSPRDFSGIKLREIMATFQEPFEAHMRSEISTLERLAHHVRTPKEGSAEEKATGSSFDAREGQKLLMSGITDVMPFFLYNFDREYEDGIWAQWPPIPGPVRWVLIRMSNILHPGWWKFASCDASGNRRSLHALPERKGES